MPNNLTEQQIAFLENYVVGKGFFSKSKAKKKRAQFEVQFDRFNSQYDALMGRIDTLEDAGVKKLLRTSLEQAEDIIEAGGKEPDFDSGYRHLAEVTQGFEIQILYEQANRAKEAVEPLVEAAVLGHLDKHDEIQMLWAYGTEKALSGRKSGSISELNSAVTSFGKLTSVIASAVPVDLNAELAGSGDAATARQAAATALVLAKAELLAAETRLTATVAKLTSGFDNIVPTVLSDQAGAIKNALTLAKTAADEIPAGADLSAETEALAAQTKAAKAAAQDALKVLDALDEAAKQPLLDYAQWKSDLAEFTPRLATLQNHPKNNHKKVQAITTAAIAHHDDAKLKAQAFDFAGACADLAKAKVSCEKAISDADGWTQRQVILKQRKESIKGLADASKLDHTVAKEAVTTAKKLYKDAVAFYKAGDIDGYIACMDKVPNAVAEATWLANLSNEYKDNYDKFGVAIDGFDKSIGKINDTAIKNELAKSAKALREYWASAKCAADGDLDPAMQKLTQFWGGINSLEARIEDAKNYLAELKEFKDRLREVKACEGDNGLIAIEAYYQRLQADEAFARDKAAASQYVMATQTLKATEGKIHTDMLALAAVAKDYLARKRTLKKTIEALRGKDGADKVAGAIARIDDLIANATDTAISAKNWAGSVETLKEAQKQADLVEGLIADAADVASSKDDTVLDGVGDGKSFAAALQVYQAVLGKTQGKDDGTFAKRFEAVINKAAAAKVLTEGESPDFNRAGADLKSAIADCEAIMTDIALRKGYQDRLSVITAARDGTLATLNAENSIDDEIEAINSALDEAANLVKAPSLDFQTADVRLSEALKTVRQAEINGEAFKKLLPDFNTIKACQAYLEDATRKDGVDKELARLIKIRKEIFDLYNARDVKAAAAKAREGADLDAGYRAMADDYIKAKEARKDCITIRIQHIQGKPACAIELAKVMELDASIDELFTARAYKAAASVASHANRILVRGYNIAKDFGLWEPVRATGEAALADVARRHKSKVDAVTVKEDRLEVLLNKALAAADERNYKLAKTHMEKLISECTALEPFLVAYEACQVVRDEAGALLAQVGKLPNKELVEPLVARLRGKHQNAVKTFNTGDFKTAQDVFTEIKSDCQDALVAAAKSQEYAALDDSVKELTDTDTDGIREAIGKARAHVQTLRDMPEGFYVVGNIILAETALKEATEHLEQPGKEKAAKEKVLVAMDNCVQGRINMGYFTQLTKSADFAREQIAELIMNHPAANFVKADLEKLRSDVDKNMLSLRGDPSKRLSIQTSIEEVMTEFHKLRMIASDRHAYVPKRDEVANDVIEMEKNPSRYAVKTEMDVVRSRLAAADEASEKRDHKMANKLIMRARKTQVDALLKLKMTSGTAPTPAEIKVILDDDDGTERFDRIVEALDPAAQRTVLTAAFEARYGCKLNIYKDTSHEDTLKAWLKANPDATIAEYEVRENQLKAANVSSDLDKKGPNIKRFYNVMEDLPESHTLENDSMLQFTNVEGPASGSDYHPTKKEVTMREGSASDSGYYGVALPHELEEIDETCTPLEGEKMTFFSWNTLHEVGHAVDDRAGFMDRKGKTLAGWENYGSDVLPVAKAVAGHLGFDAGYIAAYMSGTADPPIPEPKDCEPEEWERRRISARLWIDGAREGKNPWQSASAAKACTIGGVCYQESYENTWTSYPYDERKKGVSGYQFRAPGEWFSELYAAYHSGKMNSSHPAMEWIADL